MGKAIDRASKEVLAEMVRLTQRQGLKGAAGGWKDFLQCHDKKGSGLSDPIRRSRELLVDFLQTFTKEQQKRLVRLTMEHPKYTKEFCFPFYDEGWVTTHLGEFFEAMKSETMLAIDCEMVLCEDGTEAVVKVCVVDQDLQVKLDQLVNPMKPVADYRTNITGIDSKDLEGVTCSLADIQKSLKKLLSHGTILVGHSLYNDLRAVKVDHLRVIDTVCIFKFVDLPNFSPSLNTLCKVVLGFPVRNDGEPHNCLNDAQAAMKLVLAKLEHGYEDLIVTTDVEMPRCDSAKLLLHNIPVEIPAQELHLLFPGEDDVTIESATKQRVESYTTCAVFRSPAQADKAFDKVNGNLTKDSAGRLQKSVSLKLGSKKTTQLYVRKMTNDPDVSKMLRDENAEPLQQQAIDGNGSKRLKTCSYPCDHVKEIEKLREDLRRREEEIFNLQKALAQVKSICDRELPC
ncbi:small RNA degrading nuclease 1-like isoform X2 [Zingiber officinale]|uniref:small RNA degrading nuclease 1-like isoform X2 n=1 Tax=Zingiber officinale TaxID=94328 RepID=UPI001C4C97CE|nr:small RNA degrading nuclease 1-like isoform X2 [Zingiber officinale]XP_042396427.1 small RNA degrading nuclease 1-like isoform X2 [Zingiber officinale]